MPSFRKKVLSACAWALPALSAVLPSQRLQPHVARRDGDLLQWDFQDDYAQATFAVPCHDCLGTSHDDESLVLTLTTYAHNKACGFSNLTLNGAYLPQEWNGDLAFGSGSFSGFSDNQENAPFQQRSLDLEWESACLHGYQKADDVAQVLTVNIKSVDGKILDNPSGFTVSFNQLSPPALLRLERRPNHSATAEHAESWRQPPPHLRLTIPEQGREPETAEDLSRPHLEDDLRELRALKAEVQKLQKAIADKQKLINSQVQKETEGFKERLRKCDNITCVVKTIASGAHGAWRVLYIQFQPHNHHEAPPSRPMEHSEDDRYHRVWRTGSHDQGRFRIESEALQPPSPDYESQPPSPSTPPSQLTLTLEIVLGILCCGCLFAVVRRSCCNYRTRAERAASCEERRNRRAYRRAARKITWRKWWQGNWRDQARRMDYEEKQSLIQNQESILEEAMQEEIRQLRAAHGVINDLVSQAEEGRVVTYPHNYPHYTEHTSQIPCSPLSTASTYPPTSIPEIPSRPLSRTDSLPGYRSDTSNEPPAYESDEDVSDMVPNGFRNYYPSTASSTASQWTPDSSIADVSPRPSADTLRYTENSEFAETTETGVGEKNSHFVVPR